MFNQLNLLWQVPNDSERLEKAECFYVCTYVLYLNNQYIYAMHFSCILLYA